MSAAPDFDGGLTLALQSRDRQAAAAWCAQHLGFKLMYDAAEAGWCELSTPLPGVTVGYSEVEPPKVGAGPVPTFGVKDIDAARAPMERAGVKFDGPTQVIPGLVKLATFYDPDGNAFMFSQSLQAQG